MIKEEDVYKIGVLNRPHGINGEIVFTFDDDIFDRTDNDYVVLLIDGIMVPFFFDEYRFRSSTTAIVKFDGVNNEQQARRLTNLEVFFPKELVQDNDKEDFSLNFLIGFTVYNDEDFVGRISDIDTSTINTLFVVSDKNGKEILIPAQRDFIDNIDVNGKSIRMNLPEGIQSL